MLENDSNSQSDGRYIDREFGNGDVFAFWQHVGGAEGLGSVPWVVAECNEMKKSRETVTIAFSMSLREMRPLIPTTVDIMNASGVDRLVAS